MIEQIIKMALCSALFLLVYFLFLQKEKMCRFNRFYLLFSFALSFLIPFITFTIHTPTSIQPAGNYFLTPLEILPNADKLQNVKTVESYISIAHLLLLAYWAITIVLFIRFVKNILKMYLKIKAGKSIFYKGARLVLSPENLTPHSFLNFIFLNKTSYEKGGIGEEILFHELTHVKQRHTIDVLLIELATVFLWFNPFVFLYRKVIRLNHEFLADDSVVKTFQNERSYQYLLIGAAKQTAGLAITSQFNFSITKKRLVMITHHTSAKTAILKQCLCMAVFFASVLFFSSKETIAQGVPESPVTKSKEPLQKKDTGSMHAGFYAGGTEKGVSEEELNQYHQIINRTKTPDMSWADFRHKVPSADRKKLESIFMQMSPKQQLQETVIFLKPVAPLPHVVPTEKQFANFKNSKIYGVWINEKKVPNSELNKYDAKDFSQVFVSKLYGAAKKNKDYSFQVNLMTNGYYKDYYNMTIADQSNRLTFQFRREMSKSE